MDGADLGALVVDGVLERVLGDARRRRARDYLFVFFVLFFGVCVFGDGGGGGGGGVCLLACVLKW